MPTGAWKSVASSTARSSNGASEIERNDGTDPRTSSAVAWSSGHVSIATTSA